MIRAISFGVFATAAVCAFGDAAQTSAWFTGLNSPTSLTSLGNSGGSWSSLSNDNAEVASSQLALDVPYTSSVSFSNLAAAPDTNTSHLVTFSGTMVPCLSTNLLAGEAMSGKQCAFAIVDAGSSADPRYSYYVWLGATGGATAIADWESLGTCSDPDASQSIVFEFEYWTASKTVKITLNSGSPISKTLSTSGTTVAGVSFTGMGSIAALNGSATLGVASANDRKYPTVDAAVAASESGTTVSVLRQASGQVTAKDGITIADNGNVPGGVNVPEGAEIVVKPSDKEITSQSGGGASGSYVVPVVISGSGTATVELPSGVATYKQIASQTKVDDGIQITLETKQSILQGISAGSTSKGLMANEANLRTFLNSYVNAEYTKAQPTSSELQTKLNASGDNGVALWQSYALGVAPTESIKPVTVPTGDTDTSNITLSIPALSGKSGSGDFTVTYKVGDTAYDSSQAIKVPATTGTYTVKVLFN